MKFGQRVGWQQGDGADALVTREWLVTNGLGGYAAGTIGSVVTRRYHGLLVAALGAPLGRTMMLSQLFEEVVLPDGRAFSLNSRETASGLELEAAESLREFRLELGLPVWVFERHGVIIEKRLFFAHLHNTVYVRYSLLQGPGSVRLRLRPATDCRPHDSPVGIRDFSNYRLVLGGERFELHAGDPLPPLRMRVEGDHPEFVYREAPLTEIVYRAEAERGYASRGALWSPGRFEVTLTPGATARAIVSTERWETLLALSADDAFDFERERRERLIRLAHAESDPIQAELALAADQFIIIPAGRVADAAHARAQGEEPRTVIAGYYWFTDWGRDTMISLEGLTLSSGRHNEARWILHSFGRYVRDGLIPNLFPEHDQSGLYHTADATLWFFHAIDRYLHHTGDRETLRHLLPTLQEIVEWHRRGTRFGIRVDPVDGLLTQGSSEFPLTWMDAKCDGWIVTPRRGKPVEINALWFNALTLLTRWMGEEQGGAAASSWQEDAARAQASFNRRFWYEAGNHLYDVVDGEQGDDPAVRPNQIFAVALPNPVLRRERWQAVVNVVKEQLWTPVGLRSLAPSHPEYKRTYHGDLRTRDAAYHQGTVWSWLVGPFADAWRKTYGDEGDGLRRMLSGLEAHLGEACLGSVSEVFDAEPPYTPRGCIAQAWSVAELLRVRGETRSAQ